MITTVTLNAAVDKLYVIDALQPFAVMRVREVRNTAGGKGLNVSRVAALAGESVTATGIIGGHNGDLFQSLITQPNITPAFTRVQGETRCCVNVCDTQTNHSTEFLEPGSPVDPQDLDRFMQDYEKAVAKSDLITICGSMPKGTPTDFYAALIRTAKQAGKRVILDTSGGALIEAVKAKPTMIKPNADEIKQLLGVEIQSRQELIDAAVKLHEGGIAIVVVSLGKDGALVVCGEGVYQGITPDIQVVNAVGCGDSMVAGFAIGLSRGCSMADTIRYAVAISTANALTAETGSFYAADLERLLTQVQVEKLR